jgi:uncharacterized membrane protein
MIHQKDFKRIYSIDFTRGLVMIIMALDHVRDMIHTESITQSPTNLETTTPILFFTRWITYLCAPTFVFLAGTSAYLSIKRVDEFAKSRRFLLKRGLYLVLLEFVVVNFGLFFDLGFHTLLFEVIATIGFGFIILSLLLKLSPKTIAIIGLAIIFFHNLLSIVPLANTSPFAKIFMAFFTPGAFPFANRVFIMAYPPIPWLGIMLVGFAAGRLFEMPVLKRKNFFSKIGIVAIRRSLYKYVWRFGSMVFTKKCSTHLFIVYERYQVSAFTCFLPRHIGNYVPNSCLL